ncbi:hypothetical protein M0638_12550, partial [Roseomonas sp. NAR14]
MPFDWLGMSSVSYGNGNSVWFYRTADALGAVTAAGYFDVARRRLLKGDVLFLDCADGLAQYRLTSTDPVALIALGGAGSDGTYQPVDSAAPRRTLQDKARELSSVLDFDGASLFTKAQRAFNSGLSFYVPDGLYIGCPDTLWMSMPSQMVYGSGAGCGFRLVRAAGQPVTPILVQLPSATGSGLRGLMFDHAAAA